MAWRRDVRDHSVKSLILLSAMPFWKWALMPHRESFWPDCLQWFKKVFLWASHCLHGTVCSWHHEWQHRLQTTIWQPRFVPPLLTPGDRSRRVCWNFCTTNIDAGAHPFLDRIIYPKFFIWWTVSCQTLQLGHTQQHCPSSHQRLACKPPPVVSAAPHYLYCHFFLPCSFLQGLRTTPFWIPSESAVILYKYILSACCGNKVSKHPTYQSSQHNPYYFLPAVFGGFMGNFTNISYTLLKSNDGLQWYISTPYFILFLG
jgi:hypothetical protein